MLYITTLFMYTNPAFIYKNFLYEFIIYTLLVCSRCITSSKSPDYVCIYAIVSPLMSEHFVFGSFSRSVVFYGLSSLQEQAKMNICSSVNALTTYLHLLGPSKH